MLKMFRNIIFKKKGGGLIGTKVNLILVQNILCFHAHIFFFEELVIKKNKNWNSYHVE